MYKMKFSDIDMIHFMGRVVQEHTRHYQSDFEIDKKMLRESAGRQDKQDNVFLWLCRTAGTWLLSERNVLLKDTSENNIFNYYAEQSSGSVLAFAVKVKKAVGDAVIGDIYVLDYPAHYRHIQSVGLSAETVILRYERGERIMKADAVPGACPDMEYGKLMSIRYLPHKQEELEELLWRERQERERYKEGKPDAFIEGLAG